MRDFFLFNKPQRLAYSDASATGCASVITLNEDCVCVIGARKTDKFSGTNQKGIFLLDSSF